MFAYVYFNCDSGNHRKGLLACYFYPISISVINIYCHSTNNSVQLDLVSCIFRTNSASGYHKQISLKSLNSQIMITMRLIKMAIILIFHFHQRQILKAYYEKTFHQSGQIYQITTIALRLLSTCIPLCVNIFDANRHMAIFQCLRNYQILHDVQKISYKPCFGAK